MQDALPPVMRLLLLNRSKPFLFLLDQLEHVLFRAVLTVHGLARLRALQPHNPFLIRVLNPVTRRG